MNKDDLIKKLENLDLPEFKITSHERRLKTALLNSGYWKEKTTMPLIKKFIPVGAVAVIALFIALGPGYFKNPFSLFKDSSSNLVWLLDGVSPRQALAKEFIDKSSEAVRVADTLPSLAVTKRVDGRTEVSATVSKDDYLDFLKEAKQAKDLSYIGDKILLDGKRVKILLYTLDYLETNITQQYAALLGVGDNDIPMVRIVYDAKTMGGVMFQQGEIKSGDQPSPSGEGVQYGKIDPNALQPKSIEEMMNFWTENLENQPQEQIDNDFEAIKK